MLFLPRRFPSRFRTRNDISKTGPFSPILEDWHYSFGQRQSTAHRYIQPDYREVVDSDIEDTEHLFSCSEFPAPGRSSPANRRGTCIAKGEPRSALLHRPRRTTSRIFSQCGHRMDSASHL